MLFFLDKINMSALKLDREKALQYQLCMVKQLIEKQQQTVLGARQVLQNRLDMRMILNESPAVWQSMTAVLKPNAQLESFQKDVDFQQQLLDFLKAKQRAIDLLLGDNQNPEVCIQL